MVIFTLCSFRQPGVCYMYFTVAGKVCMTSLIFSDGLCCQPGTCCPQGLANLMGDCVCFLVTVSSLSLVARLLSGDAGRLLWQTRAMSPSGPGTAGLHGQGPGRLPGGHTVWTESHMWIHHKLAEPYSIWGSVLSESTPAPVSDREQKNEPLCGNTCKAQAAFLEGTQQFSLFVLHITRHDKPIVRAFTETIRGPDYTAIKGFHTNSRWRFFKVWIIRVQWHHTHFNNCSSGQLSVLHERVDDRRQEERLLSRQGEHSVWSHDSPGCGNTSNGWGWSAVVLSFHFLNILTYCTFRQRRPRREYIKDLRKKTTWAAQEAPPPARFPGPATAVLATRTMSLLGAPLILFTNLLLPTLHFSYIFLFLH